MTYTDEEIKSIFNPTIASKTNSEPPDLTKKFSTFLKYTNYTRDTFLDFLRTGNDVFNWKFNETEASNYRFAMKNNEKLFNNNKTLDIKYKTNLNASEYKTAKTLRLDYDKARTLGNYTFYKDTN